MGQSVLGVETAAYNLELSVEASTGKDEPDHGSQGVGREWGRGGLLNSVLALISTTVIWCN